MQANIWENLPLVLTAKQTAGVLGVSTGRVYAMLRDGSLPTIKIGKIDKIYRDALRHKLEAASA